METLEKTEEKTVTIAFKLTPTMDKEITQLLEKNKWKKSAFIRVAIQESMNRLKGK